MAIYTQCSLVCGNHHQCGVRTRACKTLLKAYWWSLSCVFSCFHFRRLTACPAPTTGGLQSALRRRKPAAGDGDDDAGPAHKGLSGNADCDSVHVPYTCTPWYLVPSVRREYALTYRRLAARLGEIALGPQERQAAPRNRRASCHGVHTSTWKCCEHNHNERVDLEPRVPWVFDTSCTYCRARVFFSRHVHVYFPQLNNTRQPRHCSRDAHTRGMRLQGPWTLWRWWL
jgi:hypothetical protein